MSATTLLAVLTVVVAPSVVPVWHSGDDPDASELLEWMTDHPDDVSIVVTGGAPGVELSWNAEVERPLASTFKTIVLAAYAREAAAGRVDPDEVVPLEDVERWLVEGTDGGSHAAMLQRYGTPDGLRVDDLAAAMMADSANTATDALLARLGRTAVAETARELGLPRLAVAAAPPAGALGLLRDEALGPTTTARLHRLGTMDANDADMAAWDEFEVFAADPDAAAETLAALSELTTWDEQLRLTEALPWRARPVDMHQLLVSLLFERRLGTEATSIAERHLSWPMDDPAVAARFTELAAKEGAAPGTLAVHGSGLPRSGSVAGIARFVVFSVHGLDAESWSTSFAGDTYQQLGIRLLEDPAFVTELGRALSR